MFKSFFLGGFECSSHRRKDGRRLDLLAATAHDRFAEQDYRALARHDVRTARDGLRWHLIETSPGVYDWSSFLPMLRAAETTGTQVIWDLCHYGWPDGLDIWSPDFVARFAAFAQAAAILVRDETADAPWYCAINEISFWAWDGGDQGGMNPGAKRRGGDLKRQLVRASIAAIDAVRAVDPQARFIVAEPLINITTGSENTADVAEAEQARQYQYEALDMLLGRVETELGGREDLIDAVGVNFYPHNQWYHFGAGIPFGHHHFRPLADMLDEVHRRYNRPVFVAETGAEGTARPSWLHYVCNEILEARTRGAEIAGMCLYPILAYPGWDNDRHCEVGLFGRAGEDGVRPVCPRTARELAVQAPRFDPIGALQSPTRMAG